LKFRKLPILYAHKRNNLLLLDIFIEAQQINLTTIPVLPDFIVATNFTNLQLVSTIPGSPISCDWFRDNVPRNFYGNDGGCDPPTISTDDYSTNCFQGETFVNFTYTIHSPLQSNVDYFIDCYIPHRIRASIVIQVQGILTVFDVMWRWFKRIFSYNLFKS